MRKLSAFTKMCFIRFESACIREDGFMRMADSAERIFAFCYPNAWRSFAISFKLFTRIFLHFSREKKNAYSLLFFAFHAEITAEENETTSKKRRKLS